MDQYKNANYFIYYVYSFINVNIKKLTIKMYKIATNLAVIVRIFNWDELMVIIKFTLCKDTYKLTIDTFNFASATPTLHSILVLSVQLIEHVNGCRG